MLLLLPSLMTNVALHHTASVQLLLIIGTIGAHAVAAAIAAAAAVTQDIDVTAYTAAGASENKHGCSC